MSTDARYAEIAEIHYWPHSGRIIMINKEPHYSEPVVTALDVTPGEPGPGALLDATEVIVLALAEAGRPPMRMVRHDLHGRMESVDAVNLSRTEIRAQADDRAGVVLVVTTSGAGSGIVHLVTGMLGRDVFLRPVTTVCRRTVKVGNVFKSLDDYLTSYNVNGRLCSDCK